MPNEEYVNFVLCFSTILTARPTSPPKGFSATGAANSWLLCIPFVPKPTQKPNSKPYAKPIPKPTTTATPIGWGWAKTIIAPTTTANPTERQGDQS